MFTNLGRCYWLKVWQIPEASRKSKGKPLINLLEDLRENERVATIVRTQSFEGEGGVLMVTRSGTIKKTPLDAFSNPRRSGIWAIEIQDGDELVDARIVEKNDQIMLFTRNGMAVRFDESKARAMGRMARGVRGITLRGEDDCVVGCAIVKGTESILSVCERGFGKRSAVTDFRQTNRGGVGVRSIIVNERNGKVVRALCVTDEDGLLMMSASGQAVRISMKDLRVMGRNTQGVKLVNLREGDYLVAIQKIEAEANDKTEGDTPPQVFEEIEGGEEIEEPEEEIVEDEGDES
jgi:DNA gyrase subunit A